MKEHIQDPDPTRALHEWSFRKSSAWGGRPKTKLELAIDLAIEMYRPALEELGRR